MWTLDQFVRYAGKMQGRPHTTGQAKDITVQGALAALQKGAIKSNQNPGGEQQGIKRNQRVIFVALKVKYLAR